MRMGMLRARLMELYNGQKYSPTMAYCITLPRYADVLELQS